MTEAQKFFSDSAIAKEKCKLLAKEYEQSIRLEKEKVSLFSPENVLDYEDIARQIFSPIHIDQETQELNTLALDDMFNKGLSVNRLKLTLITDLHLKGEEKALLQQLSEEFNVDTLPAAKKKMESFETKTKKLVEKINQETAQLVETYFTEED